MEVTPLPPSVGVVGGTGGVDALLGGGSSSSSFSPLSPSPLSPTPSSSPLSPTPLTPLSSISPTPLPTTSLIDDVGGTSSPVTSLPCTTLAPVSHADSPDDLALRNILYEKEKDVAQESVTKVINTLTKVSF